MQSGLSYDATFLGLISALQWPALIRAAMLARADVLGPMRRQIWQPDRALGRLIRRRPVGLIRQPSLRPNRRQGGLHSARLFHNGLDLLGRLHLRRHRPLQQLRIEVDGSWIHHEPAKQCSGCELQSNK